MNDLNPNLTPEQRKILASFPVLPGAEGPFSGVPKARHSPFYWCRCKPDCKDKMTLAEREEHERTEHPDLKPRKDLDDVPPELRRKTWA